MKISSIIDQAHTLYAGFLPGKLLVYTSAFLLLCSVNMAKGAENETEIIIDTNDSIAHLGSIDSFDITPKGKKAARLLSTALNENKPELAGQASDIYDEIIPLENFGGEYSALQWFCEILQGDEALLKKYTEDPFTKEFYNLFADDNYAVLKEYLQRKYRLDAPDAELSRTDVRRLTFLDDFILFNNPRRERWEKTEDQLKSVPIKKGQTVIDIGCGPGFFTYRFSKMVGPEGKVYAVDLNDLHINYLTNLTAKLKIENVDAACSRINDIMVEDQADLAYLCSLYHVLYMTLSPTELDELIASIRKALKPEGVLAIVDNALVGDENLPYHGPYIKKELIIAQMRQYGFRLDAVHQHIPQRYVLLFRLDESWDPNAPPVHTIKRTDKGMSVATRKPLIHLPNDASDQMTPGARDAAIAFYASLESKDRKSLEIVRDEYNRLAVYEKIGDEYSAFAWLCDYVIADPAQKEKMRAGYNAEYVDNLKGENWEPVLTYLNSRYKLTEDELKPYRTSGFDMIKKRFFYRKNEHQSQGGNPAAKRSESIPKEAKEQHQDDALSTEDLAFWRDFILFNNPRRESWEKTSHILKALDIQKNERIGDIGCGPGYYSFMFSDKVGKEGKVYAIDTNTKHLEFLNKVCKDRGLTNIESIESRFDDCRLPENSVDTVFLCSLYSVIYTTSMEDVKDRFIGSIQKGLVPGGRLIIADNAVVPDGTPSYHGPFMAKELIIAQMEHYGFKFEKVHQFTPQRYVLEFRLLDKTSK